MSQNKIRCIVVDDEPIAVDYIKSYVEQIPELELVGFFYRAADSYEIIKSGSVDLMFLDIQMPGMTGLEFIRTLDVKPRIILTTAYPQYALDGYNLDVSDYLLKPIKFERFKHAISKVCGDLLNQNIKAKEPEKKEDRYIFLKNGYKSTKVMYGDVLFIESSGVYAIYHTSDGHKYMRNERMKNIEEQLPKGQFLRIHKSYLVNKSKIKAVYSNTLEVDNHTLPIGRIYKDLLKEV